MTLELFGVATSLLALFAGFGVLIGLLFGFFGMGGSFLVTPALMVMGYETDVAVASGLAFVFATSVIATTQAIETAVLVDWARSLGAPTVGVGGLSLDGIVTMFVAAHAGTWPERMRPGVAIPVAASADIGDLLFESSLTEILGVTGALRNAGWTPELMAT